MKSTRSFEKRSILGGIFLLVAMTFFAGCFGLPAEDVDANLVGFGPKGEALVITLNQQEYVLNPGDVLELRNVYEKPTGGGLDWGKLDNCIMLSNYLGLEQLLVRVGLDSLARADDGSDKYNDLQLNLAENTSEYELTLIRQDGTEEVFSIPYHGGVIFQNLKKFKIMADGQEHEGNIKELWPLLAPWNSGTRVNDRTLCIGSENVLRLTVGGELEKEEKDEDSLVDSSFSEAGQSGMDKITSGSGTIGETSGGVVKASGGGCSLTSSPGMANAWLLILGFFPLLRMTLRKNR